MKNIVSIMLASIILFATVPTANADNSEEVIIGILGGALGGLVIGEIIGNNRRNDRVYVYEQPYAEPVCRKRWVTVWDPYVEEYVKVRKVICQ